MYPNEIKKSNKVELKLGIKSSLNRAKPVLALIYFLWEYSNNDYSIDYSEDIISNGIDKIKLKDEIFEFIKDKYNKYNLNAKDLEENIRKNPLIDGHIETLIVPIELVWRIARVKFKNEKLNFSAERTGGKRYPKILNYSKNMDLLLLLLSFNKEKYEIILLKWISEEEILEEEIIYNEKIVKIFTLFSEEAIYRIKIDENTKIDFFQQGIYSRLIEGEKEVYINDYQEPKGSLRILKKIIEENLNYYIEKGNLSNTVSAKVSIDELEKYSKRIETTLQLFNFEIEKIDIEDTKIEKINELKPIDRPHNRIIYGAPGTGKSYFINQEKEKYFKENNIARVTFYPGYTYGQFIGTYKPKPIYKDNSNNEVLHNGINIPKENHEPIISYEFVPGELMKILVKALNDSENPYCLIIEEINRVKADSVFGDFFQLLDRDSTGRSEYNLNCSDEVLSYLKKGLKDSSIIENNEIYLPSNLYIWATMNNADQGVFPMDTAFKRRWNFEYLQLNQGENYFKDYFVTLGKDKTKSWNEVRKFINNSIKDSVSEDRLLAPFFIKENDFVEKEGIKYLKPEIFINKVIMYLKEDILRHRKVSGLFYEENVNFNDLYTKYNNGEGENILKITPDEEEKEKQEIEE